MEKLRPAASALHALRNFGPTRSMIHGLVGFKRPFKSLHEASAEVARYRFAGHVCRENANLHLALAREPRPSDYAALFHLRSILPQVRRIFDLGGNVGNLFYCYSRYLVLPASLTWTVYDLPGMMAMGEELARRRKEDRLRFTNSIRDADGADLLIASGSLHYFELPLCDWVADLKKKPKYVLINRTPLIDARQVSIVQDAGYQLLACNLFNRDELLLGFRALGYESLDNWRAEELSIQIPCYPEFSVPAYSGMFLELKDDSKFKIAKADYQLVGLSVPE